MTAQDYAGADTALALAAEYEAGLKKMEASGYEEFADAIPNHKLIIKALRAFASARPSEAAVAWVCACCGSRGVTDGKSSGVTEPRPRASPPDGAVRAQTKVVGKVTGAIYEGDQVPGMPGAICHACGLKSYPCVNPDCPNAPTLAQPSKAGTAVASTEEKSRG